MQQTQDYDMPGLEFVVGIKPYLWNHGSNNIIHVVITIIHYPWNNNPLNVLSKYKIINSQGNYC